MKTDYEESSPGATARRPWPSCWIAPAMMLFGLLAGVGFGVGHHQYYKSYNGSIVESADQQQWAVRIGTGLAFLTKTAFTAVIGVAFSQYLWVIARRKALTLRSLDAAFTLTSSPTSFFDFSVLTSAKLLTLIGIASWLLPLIALVTPATLTVENRPTTNVTGILVNMWSDITGPAGMGSPSPGVGRTLTATSADMSIIPVAAPYPNSSYSIQFYGPCLKCQSLSNALSTHDFDNVKELAGNDTSLSELWDGYGRIQETAWIDIHYNGTRLENYNMILIGGVDIVCQFRNASYNVDYVFERGIQSTTIASLDLEPVLNYSYHQTIPMLPPNGRAYISMLLALGALLNGEFGAMRRPSSAHVIGGDLPIMTTGLVACPEFIGATGGLETLKSTTSPWMCRNGSLGTAIEDLSHNFTLSLLSSASFSTPRLVDVTMSFPMNYYNYHPKVLAISYLTGLGVTLACFLIGTWACQLNGYSAWTSFSTIMHTTRNPQLDELAKTDGDRAYGWKSAFRTVKLQYGIVNQGGEMGHAAFGKADTITRIARL